MSTIPSLLGSLISSRIRSICKSNVSIGKWASGELDYYQHYPEMDHWYNDEQYYEFDSMHSRSLLMKDWNALIKFLEKESDEERIDFEIWKRLKNKYFGMMLDYRSVSHDHETKEKPTINFRSAPSLQSLLVSHIAEFSDVQIVPVVISYMDEEITDELKLDCITKVQLYNKTSEQLIGLRGLRFYGPVNLSDRKDSGCKALYQVTSKRVNRATEEEEKECCYNKMEQATYFTYAMIVTPRVESNNSQQSNKPNQSNSNSNSSKRTNQAITTVNNNSKKQKHSLMDQIKPI